MTKRPDHAMPHDVTEALRAAGVRERYDHRPQYQRNDYVGWIIRTKTFDTRRERIEQMVAELRQGGVYMGMKHTPSAQEAHAQRLAWALP